VESATPLEWMSEMRKLQSSLVICATICTVIVLALAAGSVSTHGWSVNFASGPGPGSDTDSFLASGPGPGSDTDSFLPSGPGPGSDTDSFLASGPGPGSDTDSLRLSGPDPGSDTDSFVASV
jgi:hypothetical protein